MSENSDVVATIVYYLSMIVAILCFLFFFTWFDTTKSKNLDTLVLESNEEEEEGKQDQEKRGESNLRQDRDQE